MEKRFLTEKDVAKMINRAPETLRVWRHKGIGPEYLTDPNGGIHYTQKKIDEWIHSGSKSKK